MKSEFLGKVEVPDLIPTLTASVKIKKNIFISFTDNKTHLKTETEPTSETFSISTLLVVLRCCQQLSIYLSVALQPFVGPWPLFQFLILYKVGRTPWMRNQSVSRPLPTYRITQTEQRTVTFMP
jgi:hypothetical protein